MKRLTIKLVDKIFYTTGVNILLLTSDEWRKISPLAQRILIQEYLKETHKMDGSDGVHVPDNYNELLGEAVDYFFSPLTTQENGAEKKSNS